MKWKSTAMTMLVVLATGASIFIGSRAIVSAASTLKSASVPDVAASDEFDAASEQVVGLLRDLNPPPAVSVEPDEMRDPMRAVAPQRRSSAPAVRRPPTYTVTAVFIDADPTAIVVSRGKTTVVRLGDRLNGAEIIEIDAEGVTVNTGGRTKTYPLTPPTR